MGAVLIVNPRASKVSEEVVERVLAALPAGVEVLRTGAAGDATALAREREGSAEAIYVLGGDGTYNEVLNGVTRPVPLGFLPGGGTSVLPRALGSVATRSRRRGSPRGASSARSGWAGSTVGGSRSTPASASTRSSCGGSTAAGAPPTDVGRATVRSSARRSGS